MKLMHGHHDQLAMPRYGEAMARRCGREADPRVGWGGAGGGEPTHGDGWGWLSRSLRGGGPWVC